jgi:hypothetical protein
MQENNDLLISLLTEMKIKTHFEGKDKIITMKLSDLQNFCIRLLELEGSVK